MGARRGYGMTALEACIELLALIMFNLNFL
jgi:hypothetical protein